MRLALTTLAFLAAAPAVAQADTLLAPAPGAQHVTAAGAWTAWVAPADAGRFKVVVRAPDGTIADAAVRTFATAPDIDFGSDAFTRQQQVLVYSRCEGDCDVYVYNPQTRTERKVRGASTDAYSETAPSIASGRIAFVRRGGRRNGVHVVMGASGRVNRVDGHLARETAVSPSRVAFRYRNSRGLEDLALAQHDGANKRLIRRAEAGVMFNAMITRYKVGWLELDGHRVIGRLTRRINPSDTKPRITSATMPAGTNSAAISDDRVIDTYADAAAVKRLSPPRFRP